MAQFINTNTLSLNAQRNLNSSQNDLATSLQRLSSGLRINSAKDDAAGLAIADRMTSQIRGLNQAVRNANDGISLAQTAEGALQESQNILQRMRELSIQSANGTNSSSDRGALQAEVSQLQEELTRIADTTTFNSRKLFDGSFGSQTFQVGSVANETISVTIADARAERIGSNTMSATGTLSDTVAVVTAANSNGVGAETNLTITTGSGTSAAIAYSADAEASEIATAINTGAGSVGITATATNTATLSNMTNATLGDNISFTLNGSAVSASITNVNDLSGVVAAINGVAGSTGVTASFANSSDKSSITLTTTDGRDIDIIGFADDDAGGGGAAATVDVANSTGSSSTTLTSGAANDANVIGQVSLSSDSGSFTLANANADIFASASQASSFSAVSGVDIATASGAQSAIAVIDSALQAISSQRADLGAIQNRFSSTISNLSNISENVSAARSRIQDADFAAETAQLSRNQILQQAGIAMLSQANANPQNVLSLLQ
jgi:flagellin